MQLRTIAMATMAATTVFAAETNIVFATETQDKETILITATRSQRSVQSIAGNPTVITSEDIAKRGFTSAPETLQKRAGLHIRNFSDNPSRASVDIRGFGENSHGRVLVLVNGRRINRPDLGPVNWSQVPMGNVDRIEVVRGANSALYGDYAVGGVINIITRRGQAEPLTEISITGGSHGFNDETLSTTGEYEGIGYAASVGHQSADGYRDRSTYETWSGSLSLENDPADWLGTWFDYAYNHSDYDLPGPLNAAQVRQDRRQSVYSDDDADESFHNLGLGFGLYPDDSREIIVDTGFSRKDLESNLASFFSFNTWKIDTYTLSPKYIQSATPFGMDNAFTLGVDASYDDLDIDLYGNRAHTIRNGSSKVEKKTIGGYVHNELSVRENLIFSGGARIEKAKYSIEEKGAGGAVLQDDSDTHDLTAYNVGVTYLPTEQLKLFARLDSLYRLPFLDEQISYFGFGSFFNKDLDPETGMAYELGIGFYPSDGFDLQCTLFRMDMEDEIGFDPFTFSNVNLDETRHEGIELAGNWQACERIAFYGNYTFQNVEFTSGPNDGNEVPLVPKNLLSAGLDTRLIGNLNFLADVVFTDEQFAGGSVNNAAGTELDAYTVVDIALRYTHAFKKMDAQLMAGIDNLFSEEYSSVGYAGFGPTAYYPAPERTYKASVMVWF
jgi:iron complex outermembrane receptor protein